MPNLYHMPTEDPQSSDVLHITKHAVRCKEWGGAEGAWGISVLQGREAEVGAILPPFSPRQSSSVAPL